MLCHVRVDGDESRYGCKSRLYITADLNASTTLLMASIYLLAGGSNSLRRIHEKNRRVSVNSARIELRNGIQPE
jgi:hypothetical protein